jgi:hypothetical protein
MLIFVPFVVEQLVRLLPSIPPKPKAPDEPDDSDDEDEQAMCKLEKAQHDADLEVWKEEVKPPKPKAPKEPDNSDDEDEQAMYKMEKAQHDADLEGTVQTCTQSCYPHLVLNSVFWRNALPGNTCPLDTYFGHYIFTGVQNDNITHIRIPFGAYAQTHEPHDNTMTARTAPTIALGPTGNQRGSHYFLSLRHGRVLRRTRWDELSMPQDVIDRVSAIGIYRAYLKL